MKALDETIELLSREKPSLTDAMVKTKVILHRLGRKDLAEWVDLELKGYRNGVDVPEYRILKGTVRGVVSNGFERHSDFQLPTLHLKPEIRERWEAIKIRDSISGVETLAGGSRDTLVVPIAPEYFQYFSQKLVKGFFIERAWSEIGSGAMIQVATDIRARLLDFLLELSENVKDKETDEELLSVGRSPQTGSLFNNSVFGHNATVIVGNHNAPIIQNRIAPGDLEALSDELTKNRVKYSEIQALRTAIEFDKDAPELEEKQFGPRVSEWLSRVANASWTIELGIVATYLADALRAYYGWLK